ncbi:MAG: PD-(D/E)XK nuclease family protein, partial [Solirubrobacterales bacterium]|nr:PD-(D/E)XK nuclease family protein [Solirubrobacterales bacterium]
AEKYGETVSKESKFLTALAEFLPEPARIISAETEIVEAAAPEIYPSRKFYATELDRYLRCGRDYFYTNILGLKAAGDKSIYLKFHSCVYDTLRSMHSMTQMQNIELTEETALARLEEFWQAAEVDAHPYAPVYKARAEEIVRRMCAKIENSIAPGEIARPTYEVKLSNGTVRVQLDAVEIIENAGNKTAIIRKYKTGKSPKKPVADDLDVLMTVAVGNEFPEAEVSLQKIYLSDDTVREIPISAKVIANRLKIYEAAIDGINKREFKPAPSDNNCPYCPHFFICPSGDHKT